MNWIKWNRERLGITQEQLAQDLGFSRTLITKWETGRAVVTIENTRMLCQYFKIDEESILSPAYVEEIIDKRRKGLKKDLIISAFVLALMLYAIISLVVELANGSFSLDKTECLVDIIFLCFMPLLAFSNGWYSCKEWSAIKDERILLLNYLRNKVPKSERDDLYKLTKVELKEKLISLKQK